MANKLILHTDRIPEKYQTQVDQLLNKIVPADVEVVRYNHHIEVSWRDINKYANCVTYNDLLAVNPGYKKDLTSDGWWVYHMPKFNNDQSNLFTSSNTVYMDYVADNCNGSNFLTGSRKLKKLKFKANSVTWFTYFASDCPSLEEVEIDCPLCKYAGYLWFYACRSLREIRFVQKMKVCGTGRDFSFHGAILSKDSVLNLFEQVTFATPNAITLGIHIDHENDEEVLAAIANAEAKGLTITVQWNGTPTASASVTYGLRKPPIYARVSEMEHPDGMTARILDWGHYVTDPSGYEEFRSVEEAREYFGLPIEDENLKPD